MWRFIVMKNTAWENVCVFISSTFNDMHAERDYLVKKVFPELSEWCASRRLNLIDVDLRWGVTEKDSQENKRVVDVCLSGIDRCRPLFLCFLGQRRGWVPGEADISGTTFENFPKLKQYLGSSVTEMEIIHALIDPMLNGSVMELQNRERAFFYFRDGAYLSDVTDPAVRRIYTNEGEADPAATDAEMHRFQQTVRNTGRPVHDYTARWDASASTPELLGQGKPASIADGRLTAFTADGKPLSEVILEELKETIARLWPGRETPEQETPLQKELDEQAKFLQAAREGFIERTGDFDAVSAYLSDSDRRPMAICAQAGLGKTSYLARLTEKLIAEDQYEVLYRFIGSSEGTVSLAGLLTGIAQEMKERFGLQRVPDSARKIRDGLYELLASCTGKKPLCVVIDAVNQLDTAMADIAWIPEILPERVKWIFSFKLGDPAGDACRTKLSTDGSVRLHTLRGFDSPADRSAMIRQFLSRYLKELDDREIEAIVGLEGATNPLYLKILLSELKVFGSFEGLHQLITTRFGNTAAEAFNGLLQRMETDPGYSPVPPKALTANVFGWLSHAKNGLEPEELADLLMLHGYAASKEDAQDSVRLLLRQLRPFLAKRDKRQDFFYESFLLAARRRYALPENGGKPDAEWHKELAEYYRKKDFANVRKLAEQAYQYAFAGMSAHLRELLLSYNYLERRIYHTGLPALLEDFSLVTLPEAQVAPAEQQQLQLIQEALEQAAPVLAQGISQLAVQLTGRLAGFDLPLVRRLLEGTFAYREKFKVPWFRPLCSFLPQPGSRIVRYWKTLSSGGACMFADRKRLILYVKESKAVQVVEIQTGRVLRSYPLAWEPFWIYLVEEQHILAVRESRRLYFLDLVTGETRIADGIKTFAQGIYSAENDLLVTAGSEDDHSTSTIYATRISTGKLVWQDVLTSRENPNVGSRFCFDPVTGMLLQTIEGQGLAVRDPADSFRIIRMYRNAPENIAVKTTHSNRIIVSENSPYIITATEFDGLTVYDRESGEVRMHSPLYGAGFCRFALSGDGKLMVRAALGRTTLGSLETMQNLRSFEMEQKTNSVSALALSGDSRILYFCREGGQIELYDTETGEKIREYRENGTSVRELFLNRDENRMVSFNLGEVVIWDLEKETVPSDPGLSTLQVTSVALSPDDRFLIVTTGNSDGAVYRIDIPSMNLRKLVDHDKSYFYPDSAIISTDAKAFAVRKSLNKLLFYSCETGEPLGTVDAVDSDHTGDKDAIRIWDPFFLPAECCLGSRNLSVAYHQNGNIIVQDPDTPEKTRVTGAFGVRFIAMQPFNGGRRLAVWPGKNAVVSNHATPGLPETGAKIYDTKAMECIRETQALPGVHMEYFAMKDLPAFAKYAEDEYKKEEYLRRIPEQVFRRGNEAFYYLPLSGKGHWYSLFRSTAKNAVCSYINEGQAPMSPRLHTSDGKYYFLLTHNRLCAFVLENV